MLFLINKSGKWNLVKVTLRRILSKIWRFWITVWKAYLITRVRTQKQFIKSFRRKKVGKWIIIRSKRQKNWSIRFVYCRIIVKNIRFTKKFIRSINENTRWVKKHLKSEIRFKQSLLARIRNAKLNKTALSSSEYL